jgi:hypothetical protein
MDTIVILLKVGLILYAIYSLVVYAARRSGNKSALKDFRARPVLRRITDEEKSALQPFLMGQGLTAEDEVRELSGAFLRHGLQSQGSSTEHDTIGDVDVLLPYDAIDYIAPHNEALVVLGKKCAVVIRVNGFDLLEGRQRAQRQQAQDAQWKRGTAGALPDIEDIAQGGDATAPETNPKARYQRGEVDILAQRTETPEEVADRIGRGGGWASAFAWVGAFVLLWVATWDATRGAHAWLLGAGLLAGLCAAWLFVRKPSATAPVRTPQPVNRVRGMLNQIAVVNASNVSIKKVGLFIGDKLSLALPSHWSSAASVPYGEVIEAELRTGDYSAVGFGERWSVADEWRRFRPVYWGRHLLHLLVGLLAIGALALSAPDLRGEAALVAQGITHDKDPGYGDSHLLTENLPKWGSMASMEGEARCEIDLRARTNDGHAVPAIDCTTVRWYGKDPVVPALDIAPSVLALASPDFIRGTENSMAAGLIAMLRMQMGQAADPLAAYRAHENAPMVVRGFDHAVAQIEAACKDGGLPPEACGSLQRELVHAIDATVEKDGTDTAVGTWAALAASARPGQENADLVLSRSQLASVQRAVRQAVDGVVAAKIEAAIPSIVPASGGVLLASGSRIGDARGKTGETGESGESSVSEASDGDAATDAAAVAVAEAEPAPDDSLLGRWARLQRHATTDGLRHFVLEGLVTEVGEDAAGTTLVRVEPGLDATRTASAGAYTLWWLFAALLVMANGVLFALRFRQAMRRRARLQADIAGRPAPGAPGIF